MAWLQIFHWDLISQFSLNLKILKILFTRLIPLTLWIRRSLSYRTQSIDLQSKSMDWFLYERNLRHDRVKVLSSPSPWTFLIFKIEITESYLNLTLLTKLYEKIEKSNVVSESNHFKKFNLSLLCHGKALEQKQAGK